MKKGSKYIGTILLITCLTIVLPQSAAFATNFTQWCHGTEKIVLVFKEKELFGGNSNLIWAVGEKGSIATFNGVLWKSVQSGDSVQRNAFTLDKKNQRIWAWERRYQGYACYAWYWSPGTKWKNAGVCGGYYTDNTANIFVNNNTGEVYSGSIDTGYVKKWDGNNTWTTIFDASKADPHWVQGKGRCSSFTIDPGTNRVWYSWQDQTADPDYFASYYDLNTGTYKNTGDLGYRARPTNITVWNGSVYLIVGEDSRSIIRWNGSSWVSHASAPGGSYTNICPNEIDILFPWSSTDKSGITTVVWPFTTAIRYATKGQYGEIYAGGDSGCFAVFMNGSWYTDSNVFTDILIGDTKDYALAAKLAAERAEANTWDMGESKSAAILAREARDKANEALLAVNTLSLNITNNFGPQIVKAQGLHGATCTTSGSFKVVITAYGATEFRVKADTGEWSLWISIEEAATATGITGNGPHVILIEARSGAGAVTAGQITIFKL